jgi:integrase
MPKITKRTINAIRPDADRETFIWDEGDGALKGFGIRVQPSGIASYLLQYRTQEGRTRRLTLGRVGVLTPYQARTLAGDKLHAIAHGADPSAERRAARKAMTVAELCDWYLADAPEGKILGRKNRPIKASTLALDRSRIERHVKPLIGRRTIASLTPADITKMQNDIADGKTAKPRPKKGRTGKTRGGRGVAARTVRMLSAIFEHARRHKGIAHNPTQGVRRFADNKGKRFLTFEQIISFGKAVQEAEAAGKSRTGIAAVRALLLTGCRRDEILALPREWFDARCKCIRFGDTKTDAQTRALGASAVQHLTSQPEQDGIAWMFPADRGSGRFVGIAGVLRDLSARAKLPTVTPHVLRHTFASMAGELGFSELTIDGLLGHGARGYVHMPDSALVTAADRVSAHIAAALDGKTTGAEVVPLRASA